MQWYSIQSITHAKVMHFYVIQYTNIKENEHAWQLAKQLAAEIVAVRPLLCKNHNYVAEF
jgi:AICAR transformylase/IMP cyclohydrolase PurH